MSFTGFINHCSICGISCKFSCTLLFFSLPHILIAVFSSLRYRYFDSLVEVPERSHCVISCLESVRYSLTKYNHIVTSNVLSVTLHRIQSMNQSISLYFRQKPIEHTTKKTQTHETGQNRHTSKKLRLTRNTFCGTWYLPHSHVHN